MDISFHENTQTKLLLLLKMVFLYIFVLNRVSIPFLEKYSEMFHERCASIMMITINKRSGIVFILLFFRSVLDFAKTAVLCSPQGVAARKVKLF